MAVVQDCSVGSKDDVRAHIDVFVASPVLLGQLDGFLRADALVEP